MQTTTFRAGATEIEVDRLSPALINRANVALTKGIWIGTTKPTEAQLRELCSDCDQSGLIGSGYYATACRHRMGIFVWFAQAEGLPCTVRKPYELEVA